MHRLLARLEVQRALANRPRRRHVLQSRVKVGGRRLHVIAHELLALPHARVRMQDVSLPRTLNQQRRGRILRVQVRTTQTERPQGEGVRLAAQKTRWRENTH